MVPGGRALTPAETVEGCQAYLGLALLGTLCWLTWTNRPIAFWCIGAFAAAAAAQALKDTVGDEPRFLMRTSTAFIIAARNLAIGIGVSAGVGWAVQIVLNIMRDRADPTATLDVEAWMYDLSAKLETTLSTSVVVTVVALSFFVAIMTNSWAAVRWANLGRTWLSWGSVIVASAATITFVSADVGAARQQFTLGPIRASIGADLTRLRDARRRKVAAQWLATEILRARPDWQRFVQEGSRVCSIVNANYRAEYRKQAAKADSSINREPGSEPCDDAKFIPVLANWVVSGKPRSKPMPSSLWLPDELTLTGGEPRAFQTSQDGSSAISENEGGDQNPAAERTPLSRQGMSLSVAQARIAAGRLKTKADKETAAASAWESAASSALGSFAGDAGHDFGAALVKSLVDTLAERVAAESGDVIAERMKIGDSPLPTPREVAALIGRLPRAIFPVEVGKVARTAMTLRSALASALLRYLPDGSTPGRLSVLASTELAQKIAQKTGKSANIYDVEGHVIGTAAPPEVYHPIYDRYAGQGRSPPPERPRMEFRGIP